MRKGFEYVICRSNHSASKFNVSNSVFRLNVNLLLM